MRQLWWWERGGDSSPLDLGMRLHPTTRRTSGGGVVRTQIQASGEGVEAGEAESPLPALGLSFPFIRCWTIRQCVKF